MALKAFNASEEAASFSHPDSKDASLGRAWRGMGYVYVEQGKLQEAKKKYEQCLKLNPKDRSAAAELKYIEGLQTK
jgi:tetratricopeptide (TPR) repeat protein